MIEEADVVQNIEAQEGIMQQTRNLHYLFQGLFLGVAFISTTTAITLLYTSSSKSPLLPYTGAVLVLFSSLCVWFGVTLCKEYSERIFQRGCVLDVLHHVAVIRAHGKSAFIDGLTGYLNTHKVFVLVKIAEGIGSTLSGGKYARYFPYKRVGLAPSQKLLEWLFYVMYFNDIFDTNYIQDADVNLPPDFPIRLPKRRLITSTRAGHRNLFFMLWAFMGIITAAAFIAVLFVRPEGPLPIS